MRRAHVPIAALTALVVAIAVAGCAGGTGIPLPIATGPLVTVETRGGECFAPPCGSTVVVERDGRVHSAAKPPNDLGRVDPAALAALDAAVRTTDYTVIRARPFTGECPTAFDGQEIVLEFGAPGGPQRIASCEVDIDWGAPLFVATAAALGPFVPLPTP